LTLVPYASSSLLSYEYAGHLAIIQGSILPISVSHLSLLLFIISMDLKYLGTQAH